MDSLETSYWFIFSNQHLWVKQAKDGVVEIPYQKQSPIDGAVAFEFAMPDGAVCKALQTSCAAEDAGFLLIGLRDSYERLPYALYLSAGKAYELLYWDAHSRFCSTCGGRMERHTEISKRCVSCGREVWPSPSVAMIVLVQRGNEVLLVQAKNFKGDYLGLVAGFVETGETLEECVKREVWEETGVQITNIRYFASQPWPYPCGLMVGFFADYVAGELNLQMSELNKGGWYHRDHLPAIPSKLSMARMLIDAWVKNGACQTR